MDYKLNVNHANTVLRNLDLKRLSGGHDFTIIVGDNLIPAQRDILMAGSEYFQAMLSHDTLENRQNQVELKNVDFVSVRTCINFIYGQDVHVNEECFGELMYVAEMLRLQQLCDELENVMAGTLNVRLFFAIRNIAIIFGRKKLVEVCRVFAYEKFESISKMKEFLELDKEFVKHLMASLYIEAPEEIKLRALLKWVSFEEERESCLLELLKCIDFKEIPIHVGREVVANERVIKNDKGCMMHVCLALIDAILSYQEEELRKIQSQRAQSGESSGQRVPQHMQGQHQQQLTDFQRILMNLK